MSKLSVQFITHSDYSFLESVLTVETLVAKAAALGIGTLALTDHNTTAGHGEFEKHCRRAGIKPLFGLELDVFEPKTNGISSVALLAKNVQGYGNLLQLASLNLPVSREVLPKFGAGLVLLEGGLKGEITKLVQRGEVERARELAAWYLKHFADSFFLRHEIGQEQELFTLFPDQKFILCQDIRYTGQAQLAALDVLLKLKGDGSVSPKFPMLSWDDLVKRFVGPKHIVTTTLELAASCNVELPREQLLPPHPEEQSLSEEVWAGAKERYVTITDEVEKRINYELKIIGELGYEDYFLIVGDIVRYAKGAGIPVGPGRGSAASSLVAYVLGITEVDPLKFGLLFERFLNPERKTRPDIDLDFCYERRAEVLAYVAERFGREHVAQIGTYGTFGQRAAEQEVKRILGSEHPQIAKEIEGLKRNRSIHAAGVIVTAKPVKSYTAVYSDREFPITHLDMYSLEELGILKIDLLALRTLTVLRQMEEEVRKRESQFSLEHIPLTDNKTFELLSQGKSLGVFQLESDLFQDLLRTLRPSSFQDLVALLALGRPGPLSMVPDYVKRKNDPKQVRFAHPELQSILAETYGLILYQEQVMLVAQRLGGLSPGEADLLRSALGKNDPQRINHWKERFLSSAKERGGLTQAEAEQVFRTIQQFSGYAFNKAHSVSYAMLTWRAAYLKANYPREFFLTLLNEGGSKVQRDYLLECQSFGVEILPPSVLYSQSKVSLEGNKLRLGLTTSRLVSPQSSHLIRKYQGQRSLVRFAQLQRELKLDPRTLENLVLSGAVDHLGSRNSHLEALGQAPRSRLELLHQERELLGIYLSVHPSSPYLPLMRQLQGELGVKAGEVLELKRVGSNWQGVLDTPEGSLPFKGSLRLRTDSLKVGASLALFGTWQAYLWEVSWAFPLGPSLLPSPEPKDLEAMKTVFLANQGQIPVVLRLGGGQAYHVLPQEFWVEDGERVASELAKQGISSLLFDPWKEKP